MDTSEVLNLAADLIERRGWARGSEAWNKSPDSPLCLEGGIMAALGLEDRDRIQIYRHCPAYNAVARYVGFVEDPWLAAGVGVSELWQWNDAATRDDAEVIGILRAAALVESARESEVTGVRVTVSTAADEQVA